MRSFLEAVRFMDAEPPKRISILLPILKGYAHVEVIRYISNDVVWRKFMIFILSKAFYDRAGRIANFITTCERIRFLFAKRMDTVNGELIGLFYVQ